MRKLIEHIISCEYCECFTIKVNREKDPGRFCNKSCSNAWQHANGVRRAYCNDKSFIEWWHDKRGDEFAQKALESFKEKCSLAKKGKTWEQLSKDEEGLAKRHAYAHLPWEEKYGPDRSRKMKENLSFVASELMTDKRKDNLRQRLREHPMMLGKKHSEITRLKQSSSALKAYSNGRKPDPASGRGHAGFYKNHLFRSSYEFAFMKKCESDGIDINTDLVDEPFRIPYSDENGFEKMYIPDFLIVSKSLLVEVKPEKRTQEAVFSKKIEAASKFCLENNLEFLVITEKDLDMTFCNVKSIKKDKDAILIKRRKNGKRQVRTDV